jgi:hypothetical protein
MHLRRNFEIHGCIAAILALNHVLEGTLQTARESLRVKDERARTLLQQCAFEPHLALRLARDRHGEIFVGLRAAAAEFGEATAASALVATRLAKVLPRNVSTGSPARSASLAVVPAL